MPQPSPRPDPAQPELAEPKKFDPVPTVIVGGFLLLSLMTVLYMWSGNRVQAATIAARELMGRQAHEQAVPHLLYLTQRSPRSTTWWIRLGDCYLEMDQAEVALKHYQHALRLKNDLKIDEKLAVSLHKLGRYDEALEYFIKLLNEDPDHAAANYHLGLSLFQAERYQEAAERFQAVAADEKWDRRAEPYRRKLAQIVLGELNPQPQSENP